AAQGRVLRDVGRVVNNQGAGTVDAAAESVAADAAGGPVAPVALRAHEAWRARAAVAAASAEDRVLADVGLIKRDGSAADAPARAVSGGAPFPPVVQEASLCPGAAVAAGDQVRLDRGP